MQLSTLLLICSADPLGGGWDGHPGHGWFAESSLPCAECHFWMMAAWQLEFEKLLPSLTVPPVAAG